MHSWAIDDFRPADAARRYGEGLGGLGRAVGCPARSRFGRRRE